VRKEFVNFFQLEKKSLRISLIGISARLLVLSADAFPFDSTMKIPEKE